MEQKTAIVEELLRRLGSEAAFEKVALRAGVPALALPGQSLSRRYEQLVTRLGEMGKEQLAAYLEAAALEAGGGFEMRFGLQPAPASDWDISTMRTAMIVMPPPEMLAPEPLAPEPSKTKPVKPLVPPALPSEVQQLDQLRQNYEKKARERVAPPVSDFDKSVQIPSLAARLKDAAGAVDLEAIVASHTKGASVGRMTLREARLIAGAGPGGVGSVLRLLGSGFQAPLMLELEAVPGKRVVERVSPEEARALIVERNWPELMPRRVRVLHGGEGTGWVDVKVGTRSEAGRAFPGLRAEAAYVPAGEYRLPGEVGARRLEHGIQLGLTPVTNREYLAFVQRTGYKPASDIEFLHHHRPGSADETFMTSPVIFVSHDDALAFCTHVGGVLPSVEGWERAAMGFGNRIWPWGDTFDPSRTNTREGRFGWTTPVASFPEGKGPLGHVDLAGNVWEWTSSTGTDPGRVCLKGGSWVNDKRCACVAFRAEMRRELRAFYTGFRVAWPLPKDFLGAG